MVILFVSFDKSNPKQLERCTDAIQVLSQLAPQYEANAMIFYTDDEAQLVQRRGLGISWNTLPSMALNSSS
jgi:hypothetical protein